MTSISESFPGEPCPDDPLAACCSTSSDNIRTKNWAARRFSLGPSTEIRRLLSSENCTIMKFRAHSVVLRCTGATERLQRAGRVFSIDDDEIKHFFSKDSCSSCGPPPLLLFSKKNINLLYFDVLRPFLLRPRRRRDRAPRAPWSLFFSTKKRVTDSTEIGFLCSDVTSRDFSLAMPPRCSLCSFRVRGFWTGWSPCGGDGHSILTPFGDHRRKNKWSFARLFTPNTRTYVCACSETRECRSVAGPFEALALLCTYSVMSERQRFG